MARPTQREIHTLAVSKGWWDEDQPKMTTDEVLAKVALIHSELSEATEEARKGQMDLYYGENGKPEGFGVEIADAVIRSYDLAGALGFHLDKLIEIKHNYNTQRPKRHGGKLA